MAKSIICVGIKTVYSYRFKKGVKVSDPINQGLEEEGKAASVL